MQRISFPTTTEKLTVDKKYFKYASFIEYFMHGTAYYYYESKTDGLEEKSGDATRKVYKYSIPKDILPTQGLDVSLNVVTVNPARNQLDQGLGTEEFPYLIESTSQLYALAP